MKFNDFFVPNHNKEELENFLIRVMTLIESIIIKKFWEKPKRNTPYQTQTRFAKI